MMEVVIRGRSQAAFNLHALAVGDAALSAMEYSEGEIRLIAKEMEPKFSASTESVCTHSEARAALEYLKGRALTVHFREGNRTLRVPLSYDRIDHGSLLASGQQVLGLPVHRLTSVMVGNGMAQRFTFTAPSGNQSGIISSIVMKLGSTGTAPFPLMSVQKEILGAYSVIQRKLGAGSRVPSQGDGLPALADVFGHLKGHVLAVEWVGAPTADPAWRGVTDWLLVEQVQGDAECFQISGPGWSVEVKNVVGWRVGARGIVLDATRADGEPSVAINLQLVK